MINLFWRLLKLKYLARRLLSAALVSAIIAGSFPVGMSEVRAALPQGEKESLSGQAGGDYLWQSLEAGDLGGIENTSQYAGWRFSALKDAYVTELCGYFKGVYSVNLYDGAYNLKASGQITGYEQWNCASIAPIAVSKGEKYYVVAEILNSPVYYRSGASMLPRQNKEAIIESGITQRINQPFGSDMKSDDSRVFGMVDVKITSKQEAEILIKKAGASLAQAVSGAAGNEAAGNFSAVVRNCAHGKCIACAAESCRIESDEQSKDQKENTFIQICAKGNCWSCTNENCAKTDAAGFVKTGYSFKNCKNNKCINCLNGQCNVTGGQEPTYYKWDAAGGGMDGGSFFMDTGTGGSGGGGSGAWESYYGGNYSGDAFGGGGGGGFDAKAAAVALVNHAFTDQDFIDALLAYMAAAKEEGITNTTPTYGQLAEFINRAAGETLIDTDSVPVKEQSTVSSAIETMAPIYSAFSMTKTDPKTGALVVTPGNPETAASTRASSLTTGWGSKMNAPVAKDADGKEIYVAVNVGEEVTAGSSFSVPLYVLENGKIVSKGVTGYSVKNSATAPHSSEEANAINANGGIVYVPVRESTPAYGLLNSSTAATFTNNGKKAAGGGVSQVAAGLPANAIVVDAPSVSDNSSTQGATVASSVISDWLPTGSADKTAAATTKTGGAAATVYVPKVVAASPTAIASADGTAKIKSDPQTVADNSRKIIDEIKSQMSETVVDESTGEIEIIPLASERTNDLIYAWGSNTLGQAVGQIEVTANADGTPINASTVTAHQAITYSPAAVRTITEGGEAKTSLVYAAPTTYYLTEEDVASIKAGNVLYAPVVAAEPLSLNSGIGSEFQPVEKTGNANTLTTGAPGHSFQATAQVSDSSAGGAQQNDTVSDTARAIENTGGLSLVDSQKNFLDDGNEIPLSTEIFYSDAVNWLRLPSGSIKDSYETIAAADYRRAGYFEFRDAGLSFKKIISKSSGSAAAAVGDLSAGSGDASAAGTAAKSKNKGPFVIGYDPVITGNQMPEISVKTDRKAVCKAAPYDLEYGLMWNILETADGKNHQKKFTAQLNEGTYTFYVRCKDEAGNLNMFSQKIVFTVDKSFDEKIAFNEVPPTISSAGAQVLNSNAKISANIKSGVPVDGVEARVRDRNGRFVAAFILADGGNGNWNYDWQNVAAIGAGEYKIDIFAKDASENFSEQKNAVAFTVAATAAGNCKDMKMGGSFAKKIDVVFVPCGYGSDLVSFEADAERQIEQFSKFAPVAQNIDKFNFRAVEVSGLDCADDLKDNMDKDAEIFRQVARPCLPDAVMVLKKNSQGSAHGISLAGAGIGFVSAQAPTASIHELGHAFFNLNDEYSYGCTYTDMSNSPNCSNEPKCEKWKDLAGAGCYSGCTCEGNYRSSNDSVMLDPSRATQFSPAASRQILKILTVFE